MWWVRYNAWFSRNNYYFCDVELSHRSSAFGKIIQDAEHDIREILYTDYLTFFDDCDDVLDQYQNHMLFFSYKVVRQLNSVVFHWVFWI
jgi:hypothetical protein